MREAPCFEQNCRCCTLRTLRGDMPSIFSCRPAASVCLGLLGRETRLRLQRCCGQARAQNGGAHLVGYRCGPSSGPPPHPPSQCVAASSRSADDVSRLRGNDIDCEHAAPARRVSVTPLLFTSNSAYLLMTSVVVPVRLTGAAYLDEHGRGAGLAEVAPDAAVSRDTDKPFIT